MRTQQPTSQTLSVTEACARWSELLDQVARGQTRVLIEENGIPVAALVSAGDLARLERLEAERAADEQLIARMREAFKDVPEDELEREVAAAVERARAKLRAEDRASRVG